MPPFNRAFRAMTIEGLGKKFQEARRARNLTLDEAARMTKIRPARLAEIEADDFSQFPSLAYAKGFLVIYGKFLDVDVTPYLDAFEDSERVTVDGYSYLQDSPPPKPVSAPARESFRGSGRERVSAMPLIFGILVLVIGFSVMKLILNLQRIAPRRSEPTAQVSPTASPLPSSATASSARTQKRLRWSPQRQVRRKCVEPSLCVRRTSQSRKRSRIHPRRNRTHQIASLFVRLKGLTLRSRSAMEAEIPRLNDGFPRPMARWSFALSMSRFAFSIATPWTSRKMASRWKRTMKT